VRELKPIFGGCTTPADSWDRSSSTQGDGDAGAQAAGVAERSRGFGMPT
jgi:hypothetical protein